MYQATRDPPGYPGGGGLSMIKFTLGALFQELTKLRNWWTSSNENLDLVRYTGCKIKFWRHDYVDYICIYSRCNPMEISRTSFMNTHPYRQLLNYKKIIVPSLKTAPHIKKLFFVKKIKPPNEMVNRWFFQNSFSDTGLLLLHTSSANLTHMYQNINTKSATAGFYVINPQLFTNANFAATTYKPNDKFNYWGTTNGAEKPTQQQLIALTSTQHTPGKPPATNGQPGNLLWWKYISGDQRVWISQATDTTPSNPEKLTVPLIYMCRYNAYDDDGTGNEIYLVSNLSTGNFEPNPRDDFYISGYPLWLMVSGLLDWWRKLRPAYQIDLHYAICIRSRFIYPKLTTYIPLDDHFIHNEGPYGTDIHDLSDANLQHWYPRILYQQESINNIYLSGPNTPQGEFVSGWESHIQYTFYFRWGGCPAKQTNIADPNSQPSYPIPSNLLLQSQIKDPETQTPENITYAWDYRRDFITNTALTRMQQISPTDISLQTDTDRHQRKRKGTDPPIQGSSQKIQKLLQETQVLLQQTPQETQEKTLNQQLQQQQLYQRLITRNILKLLRKLNKQQSTYMPLGE